MLSTVRLETAGFSKNVGIHLPNRTVSHSRKSQRAKHTLTVVSHGSSETKPNKTKNQTKPNQTNPLVTSQLHASVTHHAHNYALILIPTSPCRRIPHNVLLICAMRFSFVCSRANILTTCLPYHRLPQCT
jgi:hypothetical protein